MKQIIDTRKLLDRAEKWSQQDRKNNRAAVVLSDGKDVFMHYAGNGRDIAKLVHALMTLDDEIGKAIYKAATVYAYKHLTAEEIEQTNKVAAAIAEVRREMEQEDKK